MVEITAALLSRDATELRELLTATVPTYAMNRQELSMPAHTPELIAQFWEVIGWCSHFDGVLVRPDDPDALGQMATLLEEWRTADLRGDGSYDNIFEQLPTRYRVVAFVDDEYVTIADETEGLADPPLCLVYGPSTDAEGVLVERLDVTYLAEVAYQVTESVRFATRWTGHITASPSSLEEALPYLIPGSRRSGSVWLLATRGEASGSARFDLRAATNAAMVSFLDQPGPT